MKNGVSSRFIGLLFWIVALTIIVYIYYHAFTAHESVSHGRSHPAARTRSP